jgi:hypothetical protein
MTVFETCNMLSICLEMYSFAPITDMGRRDERRLQMRVNSGDWNMLGLIARWGHNTLLIGLALMTYVLFFSLLK